jgi:hypothetical protein
VSKESIERFWNAGNVSKMSSQEERTAVYGQYCKEFCTSYKGEICKKIYDALPDEVSWKKAKEALKKEVDKLMESGTPQEITYLSGFATVELYKASKTKPF